MSVNVEGAPAGPPGTYYGAPNGFPYQQQQQQMTAPPVQQPGVSVANNASIGIRELSIGVGTFVITLGLANLLGIYLWPHKYLCYSFFDLNESKLEEGMDREKQSQRQSEVSGYTSEKKRIIAECDALKAVYISCNVISVMFSCAGGALLLIGAVLRNSGAAIGAVGPLALCMLFILIQTVPIYCFAIVRYAINVGNALIDRGHESTLAGGKKAKVNKPLLGMTGQHVMTVVGCLFFLILYVGFIICAILLRKWVNRGRIPYYGMAGPYPTQMQQPPSNYQMQPQMSSYNQATPYGVPSSVQYRPPGYGPPPPEN